MQVSIYVSVVCVWHVQHEGMCIHVTRATNMLYVHVHVSLCGRICKKGQLGFRELSPPGM